MNFFESQAQARRNTFRLILLFVLAVAALIILANLLVMVVFGLTRGQLGQNSVDWFSRIDWTTFASIAAAMVGVILVGSLYKMATLSAGGKVVAESLGGRLISPNTQDLQQRKLLNVVEEMAIASGTPPPPVYLLADEPGINAFAAGFSPRDAVIGVTRGTIEQLDREQLQGVIGHEFSHIFNGDMRLNIRLMGVLHGILVIGIAGYYILRVAPFSRRGRSNSKGGGGILAFGIGLMVIGFAGTFFGGLIRSAVSRQREYLADASSVQFTRNPNGIAGALKRIGGLAAGSKVENPAAGEVSHAFFAQGVAGFMQTLSATHPPLARRIRRIDPRWDGKFDSSAKKAMPDGPQQKDSREPLSREAMAEKIANVVTGVAMADVTNAMNQIGNPDQASLGYSRDLIAQIPTVICEAAREPYGARAVIYAMLLDSQDPVRGKQIGQLVGHADKGVLQLTRKLVGDISALEIEYRLPLIDLTIPSLKQLSLDQYRSFKANLVALIEMDSRVDLFEWSLQKVLFNHLDSQFFKPTHARGRYANAGDLNKDVELLLSLMAYAGQQDEDAIRGAFEAAVNVLGMTALQLIAGSEMDSSQLDGALQRLQRLKPKAKQQFLLACATCVIYDQVKLASEVELLRAFADALGCPMPPVMDGAQC